MSLPPSHGRPRTGEPLAVASATHKAYERLRRMIVVGEFEPGEKLKITTLCERLDTGASPVREALSLLTSDHLVERIDQRGFRAASVSLKNFHELLELRCSLESMALQKSLANADDSWEEQLVLCHHRMSQQSQGNNDTFEDLHKAFHMALLGNCDAPVLLKFCSQLYDLNIRYRYVAGNALSYRKRNVGQEHRHIMDAAIAGDAVAAAEKLVDHYRKTGAYLSDILSANH